MNFNELINDSHISKWQATHETWKVFDQLRSNGCFCDIVLKSNDGVTFPAHRLIICTCSQYFRFVKLENYSNSINDKLFHL